MQWLGRGWRSNMLQHKALWQVPEQELRSARYCESHASTSSVSTQCVLQGAGNLHVRCSSSDSNCAPVKLESVSMCIGVDCDREVSEMGVQYITGSL